jgi:uncharacterized protein YjbI with pentapeptide repeats
MAPRRPGSRFVGASQAPDLVSDQLASVEVDGLQARFGLEDVRLCSAPLAKTDAGSGRFERAHLEDVDLGESKLRAVQFIDVIAERIDAANGDWGGAQLRRTLFSGARLTGLDLAEARIEPWRRSSGSPSKSSSLLYR